MGFSRARASGGKGTLFRNVVSLEISCSHEAMKLIHGFQRPAWNRIAGSLRLTELILFLITSVCSIILWQVAMRPFQCRS